MLLKANPKQTSKKGNLVQGLERSSEGWQRTKARGKVEGGGGWQPGGTFKAHKGVAVCLWTRVVCASSEHLLDVMICDQIRR